jgi:hypothetical protein
LFKLLQFSLFLEEVLTGRIALLLQGLFLGQLGFGNAFVVIFLSQLYVCVRKSQIRVLETFQFLLSFVDLAAKFVSLSL